jgi:hypothetical protein
MMVRPGRQEPSLWKIASFWHQRNESLPNPERWLASYHIGLGEPFCFKCQWVAPVEDGTPLSAWKKASAFLDRAHLVTRSHGGLDLECNLVPLCERCHLSQPDFLPGDEDQALRWLKDTNRVDPFWQIFTDSTGSAGTHARIRYMSALENLRTSVAA